MNSRRLMGFISLAENHLLASLIRTWSDSHVPHRGKTDRPMSALGHSRPIHSASVPNNVRLAPKETIIHPGTALPLDLALTAESVSALGPLTPNSGRAPCLLWATPG